MTREDDTTDHDLMDRVIAELMEEFLAWVAPRDSGEARLHLAGYVNETVIYVAEPSPSRVPGLLIGCLSRAEWATIEPLEGVFLYEMVELIEPGFTLPHRPGDPGVLHADRSCIHWRPSAGLSGLIDELPHSMQEISDGRRPSEFVDCLPDPWPGPPPRPRPTTWPQAADNTVEFIRQAAAITTRWWRQPR